MSSSGQESAGFPMLRTKADIKASFGKVKQMEEGKETPPGEGGQGQVHPCGDNKLASSGFWGGTFTQQWMEWERRQSSEETECPAPMSWLLTACVLLDL